MTPRRNIAAAMGRWSARHRWAAVLLWLLFVAVAVTAGGATEQAGLTAQEQVNGEAQRAQRILDQAGFALPARESVFVHSDSATADDPAFKTVVDETVAALSRTAGVTDVGSPLGPGAGGPVSADRHSALVLFSVTGDAATAKERVSPALATVDTAAHAHPDFRIAEFGEGSFAKAYDDKLAKDYTGAETLSFPITLAILLIAFGALVAATLPLVLALTSLVAAGGAVTLTSHLAHVDANGTAVMGLVGIAVGVDYSLFYIRRVREERALGRSGRDAVEVAAATSGRAVLVSGLAVIAALAGMFLSGNGIQTGMAEATIVVVAIAVLGSVTVLPAMLSLLGDRIDKGRLPLLGRARAGRSEDSGRGWARLLGTVLARPVLSTVVATGALLALLAPAFALRTVDPGFADLSADHLPALRTYAAIQQAFPGSSAPAKVVLRTSDVTAEPARAAIDRLRRTVEGSTELHGPVTVEQNADHTVALVSLGLAGNGTDRDSVHALGVLRDQVLPASLGTLPGAEIAVAGITAASVDTSRQLSSSTPLVVVFVLVLTFLIMLVSFRSVTVAGLTLALNLLSVGAAYGLVVAVFQWGFGHRLLGFESNGGITSWVPLFLFVILFGLSMDYHVLVVSRIRELRDRGATTERAISEGIRHTAGAVTSAAVVMVAVAAVFTTMPEVSMKEAGLGLSAAVLIDAAVVRTVLLPASMKLLGDRSWYVPRWLGWLPVPAGESGPAGPAGTASGRNNGQDVVVPV
ncbi:MMPL family transporter [Streptomyces sp. FH025]|uniref:MMPL family transporter n=1 Tax=Streptomyces sp. FH025 TaxID=2815937 RepID=UPI001A9EF8D8|nr:MMPL family transporter [Streptomyces sp. FH025]MBO1414770.1 MMPL family transporter [Streptomyces sp. FH025]